MRALSRKKAYRKSLLRNLATSLILYERITTTEAKAKEVKPVVEHLINQTRKNDLNARRRLLGFLFDENAVKKVIEDIIPRYKNIPTGFIKSYKLPPRLGDGSRMMILELKKVEKIESKDGKEETSKESKPKEGRKTTRKTNKTSNS